MKRLLSLVLALALTVSLGVSGAHATSFTDDSTVQYQEAVTVLSAIRVMGGYSDGSFNPTARLTRGAAARFLCNLILGPDIASGLSATQAPYKDVPTDHAFASYITYCSQKGLIGGYADGSFRPSAPLSGYAFLKMLLCALGYDSAVEGYTGSNWEINVARQALNLGLADGLWDDFVGRKDVTREEACLYALNALQTATVEYKDRTVVNVNGSQVVIAGDAKPSKWEDSRQDGSICLDGLKQLGEQVFPQLIRTAVTDTLGRPAVSWSHRLQPLGTFTLGQPSEEGKPETPPESGGGAVTPGGYLLHTAIDGVTDPAVDPLLQELTKLNPSDRVPVSCAGNGALTQIFVDDDSKEITISVCNTYLAIASEDYDRTKGTVSLTVYGISRTPGGQAVKTLKPDAREVFTAGPEVEPLIEELRAGEPLLVTVAKGAIQSVRRPTVLTGAAITQLKQGSGITAGGEPYLFSATFTYGLSALESLFSHGESGLKDVPFTLYLDEYGYVIGVEAEAPLVSYCFLAGLEVHPSNLVPSAEGTILLPDGSSRKIPVDLQSSTLDRSGNLAALNTWCSYEIRNGVWTLTEVQEQLTALTDTAQAHAAQSDAVLNSRNIALSTGAAGEYARVYGNDRTSFLLAELNSVTNSESIPTAAITGVRSAAVGAKNVNLKVWGLDTVDPLYEANGAENVSSGYYLLYDNSGYILSAVVVGADASEGSYVFVCGSDVPVQAGYDSTWGTYYEYPVVENGSIDVLQCTNPGLTGGHLFTNAQAIGPLTALSGELTSSDPTEILTQLGGRATGVALAGGSSITLGGHSYPCAPDCQVFLLDGVGGVTETPLSELTAAPDAAVWFRLAGGQLRSVFILSQP